MFREVVFMVEKMMLTDTEWINMSQVLCDEPYIDKLPPLILVTTLHRMSGRAV